MTLIKEVICHWFGNLKLSRILILVALALVTIPLFTHYYISNVEGGNDVSLSDVHRTRNKLDIYEDYSALKASDLKMRIEEMIRIKGSVSTELRDLEAKRQKLQSEISSYSHKIDLLKNELNRHQAELNRLKLSVVQAQVAEKEAVERNSPVLGPPLVLVAKSVPQVLSPPSEPTICSMEDCFDYSRCPLTSGLPVYLYDTGKFPATLYLKTTVNQVLGFNPHYSQDPASACLYIVLVGEGQEPNLQLLSSLPYWGGDGRNHVLLHLTRSNLTAGSYIKPSSTTGRAIIAQSHHPSYRYGFDVVVGSTTGPPGGDVWRDVSFMIPARRRYLFTFQGVAPQQHHIPFNMSDLKHYISKTQDEVMVDVDCEGEIVQGDWGLCSTEASRLNLLGQSTFALIPTGLPTTTTRLYETLKAAAVPVFLGDGPLPFEEAVRWRGAGLVVPWARIPELHFLVRSVLDGDIVTLRLRGRSLWERYLSSTQAVLDTLLALLSDRLLIPPPPASASPSDTVFPPAFTPLKTEPIVVDAEPEESLGPLEPPYPSPAFRRNFSIYFTQGHDIWNTWVDPFHLYPHLPFDPVLPSDAKFVGSEMGFRPIGGGAGGAGREFCDALGGNHPREQFTIVMLTYEREQVLMNSLSRLHGLPYLNKVIVVWNSPKPPLQDLRWPDIGVPIHVVKASKNSLNNRFLPYDSIDTEAVLSVDDDAHLRHDEIIFGFRVWREQRDRVVGFPGRFHALDLNYGGWLYNSNYSCELSMVLTGAAFIHKYYTYLYSHWLPQAIRDKVDEYMNCEDIAMNFLVSHFTRKPPIKVTSRWTFRCPGCPVSLSEDDTHFQERHKCINFFSQVFGYTPLLNTQFRADSILFKTRIPHDKQKCFKFI